MQIEFTEQQKYTLYINIPVVDGPSWLADAIFIKQKHVLLVSRNPTCWGKWKITRMRKRIGMGGTYRTEVV